MSVNKIPCTEPSLPPAEHGGGSDSQQEVHALASRETRLIQEPPPPVGPYSSLRLGPYGGPRGGAVSYGRGTPCSSASVGRADYSQVDVLGMTV